MEYNVCIWYGEGNQSWCSTKVDDSRNHLMGGKSTWGYCALDCPNAVLNNSKNKTINLLIRQTRFIH